jgi:hypothetical protein
MNQLSFVKSDVLVGNAALVINPLSFVKSLVFVGIFRLSILSYTAFLLGAILVTQSHVLS